MKVLEFIKHQMDGQSFFLDFDVPNKIRWYDKHKTGKLTYVQYSYFMTNELSIDEEDRELFWAYFAPDDDTEDINMKDFLSLWQNEDYFE